MWPHRFFIKTLVAKLRKKIFRALKKLLTCYINSKIVIVGIRFKAVVSIVCLYASGMSWCNIFDYWQKSSGGHLQTGENSGGYLRFWIGGDSNKIDLITGDLVHFLWLHSTFNYWEKKNKFMVFPAPPDMWSRGEYMVVVIYLSSKKRCEQEHYWCPPYCVKNKQIKQTSTSRIFFFFKCTQNVHPTDM